MSTDKQTQLGFMSSGQEFYGTGIVDWPLPLQQASSSQALGFYQATNTASVISKNYGDAQYLAPLSNYDMHEQTARMEEARAEQARMWEVQRQRQAAESLAHFIRAMGTPAGAIYKDRTQELMDKFPETTEY